MRLGADAISLFKFAVARPGWTLADAREALDIGEPECEAAVKQLAELMLIRQARDPDREWEVVSPEAAAAELLAEDDVEIRRRQAEVAGLRTELMALLPAYFEARRSRRRSEAIDSVDDGRAVQRVLAESAARARQEIRVQHAGAGLSRESLDASLAADLPTLERGIALRVVLQHATRQHLRTQRWAAVVVAAGAQVRTVAVVPRRLILIDTDRAVIPQEGGRSGAVLVEEPAIVEHLGASFEHLWTGAVPFPVEEPGADAAASDEAAVRDDLRAQILRLLADGATDDVVARRTGLSPRTCRRYVATLMEELGAGSRFQAGVLAERAGLIG
jgi:DNA-binding CsgD family transcriptional regulator